MSLELELRAMLRDVVRDVVREEMGMRPTELERELLTYEQAASPNSSAMVMSARPLSAQIAA